VRRPRHSTIENNGARTSPAWAFRGFPDPFKPTVAIRFEVPESSEVSLMVSKMLGQEVAVLVSGQMEQGSYGRQFDAGNLSSGKYFYRLSAGDLLKTMLLLFLQ
jgi:hypothetical protein